MKILPTASLKSRGDYITYCEYGGRLPFSIQTFLKNVNNSTSKCEPQDKWTVKAAAAVCVAQCRMQRGKLTIYSISIILFFPSLAALSTSCQPVQQKNNREKWSPSEAGRLLLIYVSISVFIHYPFCLLGSQLQVGFRSNCEQHDNCVSVAHKNQTKHKMYTEQIYIPALNFSILKSRYFLSKRPAFNFFCCCGAS